MRDVHLSDMRFFGNGAVSGLPQLVHRETHASLHRAVRGRSAAEFRGIKTLVATKFRRLRRFVRAACYANVLITCGLHAAQFSSERPQLARDAQFIY